MNPGESTVSATDQECSFRDKTSLTHSWNAYGCSSPGLSTACRHEDAFRQEVILASVLIPLALLMPVSSLNKALMVASVLLVVVVKILNSVIAAAINRISLDRHRLPKLAKDICSSSILIALLNVAMVWTLVLVNCLGP